jgi:hypothetical protein
MFPQFKVMGGGGEETQPKGQETSVSAVNGSQHFPSSLYEFLRLEQVVIDLAKGMKQIASIFLNMCFYFKVF